MLFYPALRFPDMPATQPPPKPPLLASLLRPALLPCRYAFGLVLMELLTWQPAEAQQALPSEQEAAQVDSGWSERVSACDQSSSRCNFMPALNAQPLTS